MTKQAIIERTLKAIHQLPDEKAETISEFAEFVLKQYEERLLTKGLTHLAAKSKAFDFLKDEEDLYTTADIKEPYNG